MDDDISRLIEEEAKREAERIMEEVDSDSSISEADVPEKLHEKLFEQIRVHEEQKAFERLSPSDKELLRLGRRYKRRRKWNKVLIPIVALIVVLGLGTVCMGEGERALTIITRMFNGQEQTVVDSGNTEPVLCVEEEEVYYQIEQTYGFTPVKLQYLPEGTAFLDAFLGEDIQGVNLFYGKDNEASIVYVIRPIYRESSLAIDIEDEKLQEYQLNINDVEITLTEYHIVKSGKHRWSIRFVYQNVLYLLRITGMQQTEVEKIVKNLFFK